MDTQDAPFLTIAVPTFNRAGYLGELLESVIPQVSRVRASSRPVELLVCDNGSSDETADKVRAAAAALPSLRYIRHQSNIGFCRNYLHCVRSARGRYLWVVGDDDVISSHAVETIVSLLDVEAPRALVFLDAIRVLLRDPDRLRNLPEYSATWAHYRDFLQKCGHDPAPLALAHTWIPSVVFERSAYDEAAFGRHIRSDFAYMYGLSWGLVRGGRIRVLPAAILGMRNVRAPHTLRNIPLQLSLFMMALGCRTGVASALAAGAKSLPKAALVSIRDTISPSRTP